MPSSMRGISEPENRLRTSSQWSRTNTHAAGPCSRLRSARWSTNGPFCGRTASDSANSAARSTSSSVGKSPSAYR